MIRIALTIVVLCAASVGVIVVIKRPDTSGLYNKLAWGSSENQIKKEYPKGTGGRAVLSTNRKPKGAI